MTDSTLPGREAAPPKAGEAVSTPPRANDVPDSPGDVRVPAEAELVAHRPALLRHCYRMLGAFADAEDLVQDVLLRAWNARASYAGDAPVGHWLMRIATNACLTELDRRKRRALPQSERAASADGTSPLELLEESVWITPAPDVSLGALETIEARETVALAFLALLQKLPPKQRAVLLLKDVVGWSADDIAVALELTVPSVNSALHRARETIALPVAAPPPRELPDAEVVAKYVRSWETHDVDALVAMLRDDVVFAMPPFANWFARADALAAFLRSPAFAPRWAASPFRLGETRANGGELAFVFYRLGAPSSVQLVTFDPDGKISEILVFIGTYRGFT